MSRWLPPPDSRRPYSEWGSSIWEPQLNRHRDGRPERLTALWATRRRLRLQKWA